MSLFVKKGNDGNLPTASYISENISPNSKKICNDFLNDNFYEIPNGVLFEKNSLIYLVPQNMPFVNGDVLRYGLLLGEIRKNRFEPSHALFTAYGVKAKRILNLQTGSKLLDDYLHGLEIPDAEIGQDGYIAVMADGVPLGYGKRSNGRIKNKYPKGLRLV